LPAPPAYVAVHSGDHELVLCDGGRAIGVHGPAREVRWMGRLVNTFDTTEGCVGLATDDEVRAIADFVVKRGGSTILLD
jgi:hypothetical protein